MRLTISGTVSPDCTTPDTGESVGTYFGKPYYEWSFYQLVWVVDKWRITDGDETDQLDGLSRWDGPTTNSPVGTYSPSPGYDATGTVTVTEYTPPATDEYLVVKWKASGEFTVLKKRD